MGIIEKAKIKKELKEQKDQHMDEMVSELKKTTNYILVTDKYTSMLGLSTQDVFKLINKMFGWLFDRTPKEVHLIYADYLEELAQEIRKANK